jgi:hypothetical protein
MISAAARQTWSSRAAAAATASAHVRARRRVAAIDELLDVLELKHLSRDRAIDRMIRCRLRRLEQEVGLPLPRKAMRARNTVRLHAALLDWQDEVLDEVVPSRRALLESDEREGMGADRQPARHIA